MSRIPLNSNQDTNYKFALQVTHLKDMDPGFWPFDTSSNYDYYNVVRLTDQPLVDRLPPSDYAFYYPNRFQISFEVSPEQIEVHVLPAFTHVEMLAMIGGLIFACYIGGYLIFSTINLFNLERNLVGKLYYRQANVNDNFNVDQDSHKDEDSKTVEKAIQEFQHREPIQADKSHWFGLPCCFRCNFHKQQVQQGQKYLSKDLELSKLLKNSAQLKRAIESLLTKD